jgi:hypothetical protein
VAALGEQLMRGEKTLVRNKEYRNFSSA